MALAFVTSLALGAPGVTGCSESSQDGCTPGTLGCPCDAGTCAANLTCDATNTCVQDQTTNSGGTGSSGASVGGNAGSGGASTGGTASGGTGGTASGGTGGAGATGNISSGGTSTGGGVATGGTGGSGAAGGTAGTGGNGSGGTAGTGGGSGDGDFTLTSNELEDGGEFPEEHTCAGGGSAGPSGPNFGEAISLEWSGFPAETESFALIMLDETLVNDGDSLGYHSAFWNVPTTVTSLPTGSWVDALMDASTISDGYLGPCPNFGGSTMEEHTYTFTLYALPDETIDLGSSLDANFVDTVESMAIDSVTLTGESDASNSG